MENSLARLLTQTMSLEVVSLHSSADYDVNTVQTLIEAMAHSIVKELRLPFYRCYGKHALSKRQA